MSRAIGLVVSDVDGTLVDKNKKVSDATVEAVARLRAAGIEFSIISARPRSGMMPIADLLGLDAPMGAFNGGTVFTRDGAVSCQHRVPEEVVRGIFAVVEGAAVDTWVFADDRWYASTDQGAHVGSERKASAQNPVIRDDFTDLFDRVDKLTFVSDDEGLLRDLTEKAKSFADRATIVQSQTYYLDVTALAANKGDGIGILADAVGVPLSRTAAFGDQANDLAMFARAGLSVVMGQAPEAIRAKADEVSTSNDEDGVAHAIDTFILNGDHE